MTSVPTRRPRPEAREILRDIASGGVTRTVAAVLLSLVIASILIIFTNERVGETLGYVFSRPSDFFSAAGRAISDAYQALFRGSIYNFRAPTFEAAIKPLTESLRFAGPLIAAGLGIALTFRAGLFNIGGQGQILVAAGWSAFAATRFDLPIVLHLLVAVIFGIAGAAFWAAIAGFLKARTGAHEVIVTIMLNYIAFGLLTFAMKTPILNGTGTGNAATTLPPDADAVFPRLLGPGFEIRVSFIVCILAVVVYWWLGCGWWDSTRTPPAARASTCVA
jgi:general nucleoside transport system permease protein